MPTNFQVQRGFLLSVFIFISILTVISSSIVIISNIITIVIECYYYAVIDIELSNVMIRLYLIIISIGIIFTEMEWTDTIRSITILQSWFFRGLSYNFAGILCYDEKLKFNEKIMSNPNVVADLSHDVIFITNELLILSSTCLMIFGILYAVMGALCLKRVRDQKMARYIQLLSQNEINNLISAGVNYQTYDEYHIQKNDDDI